jgi:hypothetical protein
MNTALPPNDPGRVLRRAARAMTAASALLLSACSALIVHPEPPANSTQRSGQVKFDGPDGQIVGDIVIRHDAENFVAEVTKGPGLPLLKISARFGQGKRPEEIQERHMLIVRASGPLAGGGWTWRPKDMTKKSFKTEKLKDSSRAWAALPEVFMWGDALAKGEEFRVCLPDVTMHCRTGGDSVTRFDYKRHENPTGEALPLKDLRKQKALETVICHLDQ